MTLAERTTTTTSPAPTLPNPTVTHALCAGATTVALPLLHAGQVVMLSATWNRHDHPRAVEVALDDTPLWACTRPHAAVLALLEAGIAFCIDRAISRLARDDERSAETWLAAGRRLRAEREDYRQAAEDEGYAAWLATEEGG